MRGAIQQRRIARIGQRRVLRRFHAGDEQVRVVGRIAHHRQDAAGIRRNGHHCPATLAKRRTGGDLQVAIEMQRYALSRVRLAPRHFALLHTVDVDGNAARTRLAVQRRLVERLHAALADEARAAIAGRFQLL